MKIGRQKTETIKPYKNKKNYLKITKGNDIVSK